MTSELCWSLCGAPEASCLCWVGSISEPEEVVKVARLLTRPGACHVVLCLDSPRRLAPDSSGPRRGPLTPEVIGEAASRLRGLYGDQASPTVLPGNPLAEIRRYVRRHHIDLVVMGKQALAIEQEYGERLVDDPPCAVMVLVRPSPPPHEPPQEVD